MSSKSFHLFPLFSESTIPDGQNSNTLIFFRNLRIQACFIVLYESANPQAKKVAY